MAPKGGKKKKGSSNLLKPLRIDMLTGTSDEDSMNDNASVISNLSDTTVLDDGGNFGVELGEDGVVDNGFEDKMNQAVDGLSQKSLQGRISCLEALNTAFSRRYVPDFILDRRVTISDAIERSLKKGRGEEQSCAAQLATSLCVQIGPGEVTDDLCKDLNPLLSFIMNDVSMTYQTRAKCCWALAVLSFIGDTDDVADTMRSLVRLFYPPSPSQVATSSVLSSEALSAWTLLSSVTSDPSDQPTISQLCRLLDSPHLDIRLAAGEAIALLLEQSRGGSGSNICGTEDVDDDDDDETVSDELVDKLRSLATDSHKYRAKKDRKTQRSSFRDILRYVENSEPPNIQIRFGQESLRLDSWLRKKHYDAFCTVLGSGINLHLSQNELVRDVLRLGEKLTPLNTAALKASKQERQLMNAAAFKTRCISRGKNRDKRSVLMST